MATAELLRRERELRGLTLEQVADEAKIPVARRVAFAKGGLTAEGGFYNRVQIRAYARALNLDEHQLLNALDGDRPAAMPPAHLPKRTRAAANGRPSAMTLAICCVIGVAFAAIILMDRLQPADDAAIGTDQDAVTRSAEPPARPEVAMAANVSPESQTTVGTVEWAPARDAAPLATEPAADAVRPPDISPVTPLRPAPPAVTQLVITSQPSGARVTVNGIGWGVTPLTIRHLPEGTKRIRVTTSGYTAAERVVEVLPDQTSKVSIRLEPVEP